MDFWSLRPIPSARSIFIVGSLLILAGVLGFALFALSRVSSEMVMPGARTTEQDPIPGIFSSLEQNDVSAYMESLGYQVDAVGHPRNADGSPDTTSAVILMPLESPQFRPGDQEIDDTGTISQTVAGLTALERFFPDAVNLAAGLRWGGYILMLPATAADVRALQASEISTAQLWDRVQAGARTLDAATWRPVDERAFLYKDFSGSERLGRALPPAGEPPPTGQTQLRLQPASAYLPAGSEVVMVAMLLDGSGLPLENRSISLSYLPAAEEEQVIGTAQSDAGGTARIGFVAPQGLTGEVLLRATSDEASVASLPLLGGPAVSGAQAAEAASDALHAQGYNVISAQALPNAAEGASLVAEMTSPRLDYAVRSQLVTMAGTVLTLFPGAAEVRPALLYRSQGKSFLLDFKVRRPDWQGWVDGSLTEAQLWERIDLDEIRDAITGRPVDQRDFLSKNFVDSPAGQGIVTSREAAVRLVQESWGPQLYPARITVPVGGRADTFSVLEQTGGTGFSLYSATDPVVPLYSSAGDPDGRGLNALQLTGGQYTLSIDGGSAPAAIRIGYVERLIDTARVDE